MSKLLPDSRAAQARTTTNGSTIARLMRAMARLSGQASDAERAGAVRAFRRLEALRDLVHAGPIRRRLRAAGGQGAWPKAPGDYVIGDPAAGIAVCTLSSRELMEPTAALPGVAIAGRLVTVNLGIERMVTNVVGNPQIRALVLCGQDSPVFQTAQGIRALIEHGVDADRRIIGARGHLPVLSGLPRETIERFRCQIVLADATGVADLSAIARRVSETRRRLEAAPAPVPSSEPTLLETIPTFVSVPSGGRREPIGYDPKGFFVISLDRRAGEVICHHYHASMAPAHEIRSHSAERVLLGLLGAGLASQLSHAGYLGAELAKAETALRLGLHYEQDKRLEHGRRMSWRGPRKA